MKRKTGVWAAIVLALVLGATAGSALAENPRNPATSPGNSGNAPGQQKKDQSEETTTSAAIPAAEPASSGPGKSDSAPGQEKKSESTSPAGGAEQSSATSNSASSARGQAKKSAPAATTTSSASTSAKSSHTAADGSKQYGNGKSTLEIAKQTKSSITIADLSEPGSSGKHKITICHNGHLITIDVHALPAHARHLDGSDVIPATSASQCGATSQDVTQTQSAVCGSVTTTTTNVQHGHAYGRLKHGKPLHTTTVTKTETTPTGQVCTSSTGQDTDVVTTIFGLPGTGSVGTTQGGVAGTSARLGSGQGGVLGIAATRVKGALPFTGFALWTAVLIGASLVIGGAALVRRSRALTAT